LTAIDPRRWATTCWCSSAIRVRLWRRSGAGSVQTTAESDRSPDKGMFTTWSGTYKDARVTAISGGSGGPEAELCMVELLQHTEADVFAVGGSGGTNERVHPGDVVIASGS